MEDQRGMFRAQDAFNSEGARRGNGEEGKRSFRGKFWKVRANVDKTRRRKWDQVNETRISEYNSQD